MFKRILIVCSANICRSPYAKYKLRQLASDLEVTSAGVSVSRYGFGGVCADPNAVRIAKLRQIDLSNHKAVQITPKHIDDADLILVMNRDHIERVANQVPLARHKTFLLGHWVGIKEIIDPFNHSDDVFELSFTQMDTALKSWAKKLEHSK